MIFRKFALWLGITKYGEWKGDKMEKSLLGVQVMSYVQYSCEDAAVQTGTQIQL